MDNISLVQENSSRFLSIDGMRNGQSKAGVLPQQFRNRKHLLDVIKTCGNQKDLPNARKLHDIVRGKECFYKDIYINNALLTMYSRCGALREARKLFDESPERNIISWNALISGYAKYGLADEALNLFKRMKDEGPSPDAVTFICILRACSSKGYLKMGEEIGAEAGKKGLLKQDVVLGTALVDMYAKCGVLEKAQDVFEDLEVRNVISWNALISGYAQHGLGEEALQYFKRMQDEGYTPDTVTFTSSLKACGCIRCLQMGVKIHAVIYQQGLLEENSVLGNTLVTMYAKCGSLENARKAFEELPVHNVVSWSALISGYANQGVPDEALKCFNLMRDEGISPNSVTFLSILKACGSIGFLEMGEEIHAEINKEGLLEKDTVLSTALVDMYAKCGTMEKAHEVFKEIQIRNVVAWNALIAGYAKHGLGSEALNCFSKMQADGIVPNSITFTCILKVCGNMGNLELGEDIHHEVMKQGLSKKNIMLGTALVDMYAKCGVMEKAQQVFDCLPARDVVTWSALISGYAQHNRGDEALDCFRQMRNEGLCFDTVSFICILKACGNIGSIKVGEEIHAEACKNGLLEKDVVLGTSLLNMYAKCGMMEKAQDLFDKLPIRSVVSWNALIAGYAQHELGNEALRYFKKMHDHGLTPDAVTYISVLNACGSVGCLEIGDKIHSEIKANGLLRKDVVLGTALVDMYVKCGMLVKAQEVFDELPESNIVSWNALISGYVHHGLGDEALNCFDRMQKEGIPPDIVTFVCILKACSCIGSLETGEGIHNEIKGKEFMEKDVVLGTSLVDMYAKCGAMIKAQEIFDEIPLHNIAAWTALMAGYSQMGQAERALKLFNEMMIDGMYPDQITFIVLLTACSHAGLVKEGQIVVENMSTKYFVTPTLEQYNCMIDFYSRIWQFDKAILLIEKMPSHERLPLWLSLLGACCKWVDVRLGRWVFEKSIELDENCATAYVYLGNIYAEAGMCAGVKKMEAHWANSSFQEETSE